MSLLGKSGFKQTAQMCAQKANYAFKRLTAIDGVRSRFKQKWFFNEFVLELPRDAPFAEFGTEMINGPTGIFESIIELRPACFPRSIKELGQLFVLPEHPGHRRRERD